MDYPFENLGPEKFQLFCQALLAKELPGVQCFPIAQPDGGRDAIQRSFEYVEAKEFAVFQVKFVRNPFAETEPHKWLTAIVEEEAPKIKKQIRLGAKSFTLMTNVPGTAHLDAGSIDRVNKLLSASIGIPSTCLWRNDLCRRLDSAWNLKWTYPELMTGPDLIRYILETNLSESRERRAAAVRAFVTTQFTADQYVKFKQVDLDNRLLDLFIDVPISLGFGGRWRQHFTRRTAYSRQPQVEYWSNGHELDSEDDVMPYQVRIEGGRRIPPNSTGAATFLLNQASFRAVPLTVLEGAPGQGKSTIAQYLCQVHRMRLLERQSELSQVPEEHKATPLRLPIKVDLRDFAAWLAKRNPFTADAEELPSSLWDRSLESFLAALIRNQSGGVQFDVSDLHAVARLSSILLVLDGLDEVADIKRRAEVVSEITKGSERLLSLCASLQVVVTSRPAAFENSPGLPEDKFRYLSLDAVTQELIDEYAVKWLKARRLPDKEGADVKRILREKLSQPHLRDLARNPMQLAILLSLIHTRGVSLPDKRTALYDSYVELFFNRESEKSAIVRENRDLLIDIHRFLAWLLHVESERAGEHAPARPSGAIEESRLKSILRDYLASEGRDPQLAETLFTGLIERVVALVSRVQGTYEFEVQPLREYFAARFLHETAPYSPVGAEKRGTRPDRFDAIARNFYWLNVTRFYAGCYSKGELASLIDRLNELIKDPDFCHLSHPRVLGATLLGDWVFTQHPKSVSEVVRQVLDGLGLRFLLTSTNRRQPHSLPLVLPAACGRAELVDRCFEILRQKPPMDYALDVLDLLSANLSRDEVMPRWSSDAKSLLEEDRSVWLEYGLHLGCLPTISADQLNDLLVDCELNPHRIGLLLKARRSDVLEAKTDYRTKVADALLDRRVSLSTNCRRPSILEAFSQAIDVSRYAVALREAASVPLVELLRRYSHRGSMVLEQEDALGSRDWEGAEAFLDVIKAAIDGQGIDAVRWATELGPWDDLVRGVSARFGERWAVRQLANVGSAIRSSSETCTDSPSLFDDGRPLCRRVRYARLRAGAPGWWHKQLEEAADDDQRMLWCLLQFTWASSSTMAQTLEYADGPLTTLPEASWAVLFNLVDEAVQLTRPKVSERSEFSEAEGRFDSISSRALALLRLRARPTSANQLYMAWLRKGGTGDAQHFRVFQADAIEHLLNGSDNPEEHLSVLASGYKAGLLSPPFAPQRYYRRDLLGQIPIGLAKKVVQQADRFPSFLVAAAERACRASTAARVRPVGEIAEEEGWFRQA